MAALVKEKLDDCLTFEWPAYVSHDWDNIPPVVPRYIVQLTKYMEGVTAIVKAHEKAEKTVVLRKDMENRIKTLDSTITKNDERTKSEHNTIDQRLVKQDAFSSQLNDDLQAFKSSVCYKSSLKRQDVSEEDLLVQEYCKFIAPEHERKTNEFHHDKRKVIAKSEKRSGLSAGGVKKPSSSRVVDQQ